MEKLSKLEKLKSFGIKTGKIFYFCVVPSSFVYNWKKEPGPEDKIGEAFMYGFEGLRIIAESFYIYNKIS